jgi:hypothetical protein
MEQAGQHFVGLPDLLDPGILRESEFLVVVHDTDRKEPASRATDAWPTESRN